MKRDGMCKKDCGKDCGNSCHRRVETLPAPAGETGGDSGDPRGLPEFHELTKAVELMTVVESAKVVE